METLTDADRICNRHKARLLTNLEAANCPDIFLQAVKSEIDWMRSDLKSLSELKELKGKHESTI
jgi:hypothetical protein